MLIQSTRQVRDIARQGLPADAPAFREVVVSEVMAPEDWDDELHGAAEKVGAQAGLNSMHVTVNVAQDSSPETLRNVGEAADKLSVALKQLNERLSAEGRPPAQIDFVRTGTFGTIGAVGGYSIALLLTEAGKAGQSTGNPLISTLAIGCTGVGLALGAAYGAGGVRGTGQFNTGLFKGTIETT